ncbi:MAG: peptidoglycan-binding protein [Cyanobacteria bacterium J06598_3]
MTLSITTTKPISPITSAATSSAQPKDCQRCKITPIMPTLRLGDRGDTVVTLQQQLRSYVTISRADGIFGALTQHAVRTFQYRMFLPTDGVVGPQTWDALMLGVPIGLPILHLGSQGVQVRWVQEILANMGLYTAAGLDGSSEGPSAGKFGPQLEKAVRRYQVSRHLAHADGMIGECTWAALARDRLSLTHR